MTLTIDIRLRLGYKQTTTDRVSNFTNRAEWNTKDLADVS